MPTRFESGSWSLPAPRWSAGQVLDTTGDGPDSPSLKGKAPETTGAGRSRVYNDRRMADEKKSACVGFDSPGGHWVASYRRDTMTDDYATDNESLCEFLDDDLRETISSLAEVRGQKSGGVIKAGVKEIEKRYEGRIIEFHNVEHARAYYSSHKAKHFEFDGALEELTPEGYYENPAECVKTELGRKKAEHKEKANAAARWLDDNDSDIHVVTNEYGGPEEVPQLDDELDVQHGVEEAEKAEA